MKLNYFQSSLTIISIFLIPLKAIAEVKPESIAKSKNQITELSIEPDIKIENRRLVEKLIQSKQLLQQPQLTTQKNAAISTSAADLDLNKPSLNKFPQPLLNPLLTENLDPEKLIIADSKPHSDPDKWSAARPDGHAPIGVMGDHTLK